jgi:N-acetylmuramoyl-L-alanine amidase CwlA
MTITDNLLTPGAEHGRPGTKLDAVKGVVIHYNGVPGGTLDGIRNYFERGAEGNRTSAHYGVGLDGAIQRWVPESERAMHCGAGNGLCIGIENLHPAADGKFTDATYAACAALTADIMKRHGLTKREQILRHYDVTGKMCPLYYVNHADEWTQFQDTVLSAPDTWAATAWDWAKSKGITDGTRPRDAITRQETMQLFYNFAAKFL